ncbi:MAG: hypothetical protein HOP12_04645 [Candidatus Eisenbacteria bacterium]|uniref:Tetratricopeptide repeat protein n=1 Tax=Eiseniibacteriota bacterium TaxID=2212470 RepID=A0A849SDJ4_UNCEI|nr:hypothetical protein [Candidatus Eisenbacteria bacterium]
MIRRSDAALAAMLVMSATLLAPRRMEAAPPVDPYQVGIQKLDEGEWAEALPIYRRITAENPAYPWGWMGLGWSLHYTGELKAALPAYRRALELGALPPQRVWLEIARCQAANLQPDSALDALDQALAAGLPRVHTLRSDRRLAALWAHPRFRAMTGWVDSARVSRTAGWSSDLRFLRREIDRVYPVALSERVKGQLDSAVAATERAVSRLDDDALGVRVMQLARLLGDGHSEATPPFQDGPREAALPVLFGAFDDGVFVTATDSSHQELLWARVIAVEAVGIDAAFRRLDSVCSQDNPMRVLSVAPRQLRYPQILHALGIAARGDRVTLTLIDRTGRSRTATLAKQPGDPARWIRRPADARTELPRFIRDRSQYHVLRYERATRELVAQYNTCADADTQSVEQYAERLARFIDSHDVERLIVDLRWNGGGDNFLNRPLLEAIVQARKVNRAGHLFVIAGRHTFSAAICFAAQLDRFTHAMFVGEPTGSSPNFVGETNPVLLPYSGVQVGVSNLAWQNSAATDHRLWIPPRIPVPWRFADWREGRDTAMEAIRNFRVGS